MRPPATLAPLRRLVAGLAILALGLCLAPALRADEFVKHVGRVTIRVDTTHAFPGGVLVAYLSSARRIGTAWALLDGRRAPFYASRGVSRAIVPVAAGTEAGPATLGIGIAARRGEQRIAIPVEIAARRYPSRSVTLPATAPALLREPEVGRDARRLLACIRSQSKEPAPIALRPPVDGAATGFGELRVHPGVADVESRLDALGGERHRGLDYAIPLGTLVRAPAAGTVLFAGTLVLSGQTIVVDHGQGVVSVIQHLSRLDVRTGDHVAAGATLGLSGESRLTAAPLLEWRVYLHAVAVDPRVLGPVLG